MITVKKFIKNKMYDRCDNCNKDVDVNLIKGEYSAMLLCDECLQELYDEVTKYLKE